MTIFVKRLGKWMEHTVFVLGCKKSYKNVSNCTKTAALEKNVASDENVLLQSAENSDYAEEHSESRN